MTTGCGAKSTPFCPQEPFEIYSPLGGNVSGEIKHTTMQGINLQTPARTTSILSSSRVGEFTWVNYTRSEGYACVKQVPLSNDVQTTMIYESTDAKVNTKFKENYTVTDNQILFLDLRHDILVRKETRHVLSQDKTSSDVTQWNQYGNVLPVNKIKPGEPTLMEYTKIYVNDELVDESSTSNYSSNPYTYAFPVYGGIPQGNTQTDGVDDLYYIWAENKEEDGGWDLYYPEYLRGISNISGIFDVRNRNRHRALSGIVPYDREPFSGAITSFEELTVTPTGINGSWAVSPTTSTEDGTDNLKAFTTLKLNGTDFRNYLYPDAGLEDGETPEQATNRLFGNPTEIPCPIAPL